MSPSLAIEIDRAACRGAAECASRAPRTFALDPERRAVVTDAGADPPDAVLAAARSCPNFAIAVRIEGRDPIPGAP